MIDEAELKRELEEIIHYNMIDYLATPNPSPNIVEYSRGAIQVCEHLLSIFNLRKEIMTNNDNESIKDDIFFMRQRIDNLYTMFDLFISRPDLLQDATFVKYFKNSISGEIGLIYSKAKWGDK